MFLTDDLGWTDWQYDATLNPTGSAVYETPNLLRLANQSMVFRNAYAAAPLCSPTRASILTGQSPARIGMTNIVGNPGVTSATLKEPAMVQNLPASQITLAESLKAAGYSTGLFGKWHLGSDANNPGSQPLQNGFDVNVGGNNYGGPDFAGGFFAGADGAWAGMPGLDTPGTYPADKYLSDALSEKVGNFIQQNANTPFFLANWDFLVHIPIQAPQALVNKYQTKINTLQSQGVDLKGHTNATYAAMVEKMDQALGNVLDRLDDPNLDGNKSDSIRNNTIVLFLSDNGGVWAPGGSEGALTRNSPLREGKGSIYEGGIRVPQMISWTGDPNIPQGTVTTTRTTTYDLYPTLLDLTGLGSSVPQNSVVDGVDFRTALEGGTFDRGLLYWHYPHRSNQSLDSPSITGGSFVSAVANKDWKLIFFYDDRHYELYNLTADIGETTNLFASNPAIDHDLSLALQNYLISVNAKTPLDKTTSVSVALPPVTSIPIPGDYNGDSVVNMLDYTYWKANFGSTDHLAADGNRNGIVDAGDYTYWRKIYMGGSGAGAGTSAAVPEPSSALLFVIAIVSAAASPARSRRASH